MDSLSAHGLRGSCDPSRRGFLITMLGAGVMLGYARCGLAAVEGIVSGAQRASSVSELFEPTIWYGIDPGGEVTINIKRAEMGQHVGTALARIVADELEADWGKVHIITVDSDPKWGEMVTGGSWSVWQSFPVLSRAGAAGRLALIEEGAKLLGVSTQSCTARKAAVHATGRSIAYGDIVARGNLGRTYTPEQLNEIPIKAPANRRLIGRDTLALDVPSKVNGTGRYGLDAVVEVPPTRYDSKVASIEDSAAKRVPGYIQSLRSMEFGRGSQVNVPIAVLIWLMIIPMMMRVDFGAIRDVGRKPRGLVVTLFVNWLVKPFSMALISWVFFRHIFSAWIMPAEADQYIAGTIILAAAPCTAMVFVWSYLTDGDPAYTLVQVSVNDLIMLFLFAPIVRFLVSGASSLSVPFIVLLYAVIAFIVIPLSVGAIVRAWLTKQHGKEWFEQVFLPKFSPITVLALLATLVFIFAFQADNITGRYLHVLLIAIPILLQVYFNSTLAYGLMRLLKVQHSVAAPGALIGASNFFELAVATAIALFGPGSGAALATVVGVLVEVPVMLSVCHVCNRTRHWFPTQAGVEA